MLLVDAVEERANVMVLAQSAPRKLKGMPVGLHMHLHARVPRREARSIRNPDDPATIRSATARTQAPELNFQDGLFSILVVSRSADRKSGISSRRVLDSATGRDLLQRPHTNPVAMVPSFARGMQGPADADGRFR